MTQSAPLPSLDARVKLYQIGQGYAVLQFVQAAVDLRLPDAVGDDEPFEPERIAAVIGADPDALTRLLRALSFHDVFEQVDDGRFRHTELSRMLRSDAPWHAPDVIRFGWMHVPLTVLQHTAEAVRTGEAAFPKVFGMNAQHYFVNADKEAGEIFNRQMTANTLLLNNAPAVVDALGLSGDERVADVGGGHGQLLVSLLERHPELSAVLVELKQVARGADERLREGGSLAGRCRVEVGDCREAVPGDADVYLYKLMMFMFDDDTVVRILQNTADSARPGARVIVVDMVLGAGGPFETIGATVDLLMVLMGGGRRRTVADFKRLYERAGLEFTGPSPVPGDQNVLLEGRVP